MSELNRQIAGGLGIQTEVMMQMMMTESKKVGVWRGSKRVNRFLAYALCTLALLSVGALAKAENGNSQATEQTATLPLISCWYKGEVLYYIRIDTSDKATAEQQGLNYVPQLANVLTSSPAAYDDIYTFTNSTQFNVVPSAPNPVGPKSTDGDYQPLWQVSQVAGTRAARCER